MRYVVSHGDRVLELEVQDRDDGRAEVLIDGVTHIADLRAAGGTSLFTLLLDRASYDVAVVPRDDGTRVTLRSRELVLQVESEQERNARLVGHHQGSRAHTVKSAMPGFVARLLVSEGDEVEVGTPLLILEAMKMENEVRALGPGTVQKVLVAERQTVNGGDPLIQIG